MTKIENDTFSSDDKTFKIPKEIFAKIFSHTNAEDYSSISASCRFFNQLLKEDVACSQLIKEQYPQYRDKEKYEELIKFYNNSAYVAYKALHQKTDLPKVYINFPINQEIFANVNHDYVKLINNYLCLTKNQFDLMRSAVSYFENDYKKIESEYALGLSLDFAYGYKIFVEKLKNVEDLRKYVVALIDIKKNHIMPIKFNNGKFLPATFPESGEENTIKKTL